MAAGYIAAVIAAALNDRGLSVRNRRILLLGLAYKPNVADTRESPALAVARQLVTLGGDVSAADPHVAEVDVPAGVRRVHLDVQQLSDAEAVVLLVPHDAFDFDLIAAHGKHVLDCCHRVSGPQIEYL